MTQEQILERNEQIATMLGWQKNEFFWSPNSTIITNGTIFDEISKLFTVVSNFAENYNNTQLKLVSVTLDYYVRNEIHKSEVVNQVEINSNTDIGIFEQFYKMNNRLRYCNGSYYKFNDKRWDEKYKQWLKSDDYKKKSFDLYYGNGIVD
jgi:hypothetical protein